MSDVLDLAVSLPDGQGLTQIGDLAVAFVLSSAIGLERELRSKSAGLRTHTIVGLATALIVLVSKYGFFDLAGRADVSIDPSRVAAQIVTGIGFIGGGLIFVRRDSVRGLTTAAVVWLTTAVGMAAGAGMPILAVVVTLAHFVIVYGYTPLAAKLPRSKRAPSQLRMSYLDGKGVLRRTLVECTRRGFAVADVSVQRTASEEPDALGVSVLLEVTGTGSVTDLAAALSEFDGVLGVAAGDVNEPAE